MVAKTIVLIETPTTPVVSTEPLAREELLAVVAPFVGFGIKGPLFRKVFQGVV